MNEEAANVRRRRASLAVLLMAAALIALWQRMSRDRDAPPPAPSASVSTATETAPPPPRRPLRLTSGRRQPVALARGRIIESGHTIGKLEGVVVSSADGRPVPNAKLSFAAGSMFSVSGDANGRFVFRPDREDSYVLVLVTAEGYLPFAPEWGHSPLVFQAHRGHGLRGAQVRLTPALDYTARVLTPEGEPLAGARVRVLGGAAEDASLSAGTPPTTTDDKGEALFHAPDQAIVEASHDRYADARGLVDFRVQVSKVLTLRLGNKTDAPKRAAIQGRVLDTEGAPVPDAIVQARIEPKGPEERDAALVVPTTRVVADEAGRFELVDLLEGRYVVTAEAPGHAPEVARGVVAPSSGVELKLSDGSALYGRVTHDRAGKPVPAFAVVVRERLGPLERDILTVESFFDAEGRYEIPHLPDGEWEVSVSALGFAASVPRDVSIHGQDVQADFSLGRGGTVRGVVRDGSSKEAIEGAKVSIEGSWGSAGADVSLVASAVSDSEGRFELAGIGSELQSIFVAASDHHGRIISGVGVGEGEARDLVVELTPTEPGEEPRIELAGIGAVLSAEHDVLVIGRVIEGGGAAEAGLAEGDSILSVDGVDVTTLGFGGAINRIRGPEGSSVTLQVLKLDADEPIVLTVVRRRIRS